MNAMNDRMFLPLAFGAVLLAAPVTQATPNASESDQPIVIRRTIPDPQAVERQPLTSDRLSTTSTRYIDARRGLRPYSTVYCPGCIDSHRHVVGYDDNFGISRPVDRPFSYSMRAPATGVTTFTTPMLARQADDSAQQATPMVVVFRDERDLPQRPAPDMRIRIHNDKPEMPNRSGAVLITADGTVIQVGD